MPLVLARRKTEGVEGSAECCYVLGTVPEEDVDVLRRADVTMEGDSVATDNDELTLLLL